MKCRICNQDRAHSIVSTIVNDPPIDVCAECSRISPLFEELLLAQGRIAEVDLIENGYNFGALEIEYKPMATRIIGDYRDGYGDKLSCKCVNCGRIYPTRQTAFRHAKSHSAELTREELELEGVL